MGLVEQRYITAQINRVVEGATKLNQWAMAKGNAKQKRVAADMLRAVTHVAPLFSYAVDPPVPQQHVVRKRGGYWSDPVRRRALKYDNP